MRNPGDNTNTGFSLATEAALRPKPLLVAKRNHSGCSRGKPGDALINSEHATAP